MNMIPTSYAVTLIASQRIDELHAQAHRDRLAARAQSAAEQPSLLGWPLMVAMAALSLFLAV
jgi:hypothetical protein